MSIYLELLQLLANSRNPVLLLSLLLETCVRFRMQSFSPTLYLRADGST